MQDATESGKAIAFAIVMRPVKKRMQGTAVRAMPVRGKYGFVYVLTVLAPDGKVARLTIDAVKGTLVHRR